MYDGEMSGLDPIVHRVVDSKVIYEVLCYPAGSPAGDWSLKWAQQPGDEKRYPDAAARLGKVLSSRNIRDFYAPAVMHMSGLIGPQRELKHTFVLPGDSRMHRNRYVPLDGVPLGPGDAFGFSGGGCKVLVASAGEHGIVLPAHVSRDSALDRQRIRGGEPRKYMSVVDAIQGWCIKQYAIQTQKLELHGFFTLPPEQFTHPPNHPKFGAENIELAEYVNSRWGPDLMTGPDLQLDMSGLITAQAIRAQFRQKRIFMHEPLPVDGPFGYTRHPDPAMQNVRNLVVVHRLR